MLALADDRALLGRWESVNRSRGGLGSIIDFNADGSLTTTIGAIVDFTYEVNKGRLTTTYVDPQTGKIEKTTNAIRFEGDTLVEKNGNGRGNDIRMTRQTAANPSEPLLGTWRYPHYSGSTAFVTFTKDGRRLLRVPLTVDAGTWVATSDQLTMQIAAREPITTTYHIDGDVLTINDHGKESKYKRARK